jgi:hypothetical protein
MSGLLRRFRRGKPKEEEDSEPVESPDAARDGDSDIYPHRAPTRSGKPAARRESEGPSGPQEEGGEVVPPPVELPEEIGPAPDEPSELPSPPAPEPTATEPVPVLPESAPPRLPDAATDASRSVHRPLTAPTRCFLCGTEMSGSFCPTCRMTWNE